MKKILRFLDEHDVWGAFSVLYVVALHCLLFYTVLMPCEG